MWNEEDELKTAVVKLNINITVWNQMARLDAEFSLGFAGQTLGFFSFI